MQSETVHFDSVYIVFLNTKHLVFSPHCSGNISEIFSIQIPAKLCEICALTFESRLE